MNLPLVIILLLLNAVSASVDSKSEEELTSASTSASDESDKDSKNNSTTSVIDQKLLDKFTSKDLLVDVIFTMKHPTTDVHKRFRKQKFPNRTMKLTQLMSDLKAHCSRSQNKLVNALKLAGHKHKAYWLTNHVIMHKADLDVLRKLEKMDESNIAKIEEVQEFKLDDQVHEVFNGDDAMIASEPSSAQWGVAKMRCPEVWDAGYTGKGVLIGHIDTGVRCTHEALADNYAGNNSPYGWFDPSGNTSTPNDFNGHGTHTMGTIVGTMNGIGVAPGATWMACKGCAGSSCGQGDLMACGQWMMCPTKSDGSAADCSKAPRIVSNSWASGTSRDWYEGIMDGYRSAGIICLFASGNSGPKCGKAQYPGNSDKTIGVASTDSSDRMSSFSSPGPTSNGTMKPNIAAPGSSIYSSYTTADNAYATLSGTSMACPHVAGVVALLLERIPNLTVDQVLTCLTKGSVKTVSTAATCGGVSDSTFPNNNVGAGRLDAVNTMNVSMHLDSTM